MFQTSRSGPQKKTQDSQKEAQGDSIVSLALIICFLQFWYHFLAVGLRRLPLRELFTAKVTNRSVHWDQWSLVFALFETLECENTKSKKEISFSVATVRHLAFRFGSVVMKPRSHYDNVKARVHSKDTIFFVLNAKFLKEKQKKKGIKRASKKKKELNLNRNSLYFGLS